MAMKIIQGDGQEYVEIDVDAFLHDGDKAILVEVEGEQVWLPLSQIDVDREGLKVVMPVWLYDKKFCEG